MKTKAADSMDVDATYVHLMLSTNNYLKKKWFFGAHQKIFKH